MRSSPKALFYLGLVVVFGALEVISRQVAYLPNIDVIVVVAIVFAAFRFGPMSGFITSLLGVAYLSSIHRWEPITLSTTEKILFWTVVLTLTAALVEFYRRREIRQGEHKFRITFDAAGIGIAHVTPTGRFASVNKKLCDILGYSESELIAKTFQEITYPEDLDRDLEFLQSMLRSEIGSYSLEKRYFHKDGHLVIANLTVTLIRKLSGEPDYFVSVIEDITERRAIESERADLMIREQAAQQASEAKTKFLANMSHEIRTPINGIIGMTNIALDTGLTTEQTTYLSAVKSSSELLLRIVNDILDFSKVEAGKLQLETSVFDLARLVDEMGILLSPVLRSKNLNFKIQMDPNENWMFEGDAGRLRQVLLNLIGNAIKFTASGEIKLNIEKRVGASLGVYFEIVDTGIGISSEKLKTLFNPFVQADSSTARKFGGTGLGLSISKQLVELMGGSITATSAEGQGSCFKFNVPLVRASKAVEQREKTETLETAPPQRILVVEDNQINLAIALKYLEKLGHRGTGAADGVEALKLMDELSFDMVFMDCQMPELDGFEATRRIRRQAKYQTLPIIALTANVLESERQSCEQAGMNDFVAKPVSLETFSKTIARWAI